MKISSTLFFERAYSASHKGAVDAFGDLPEFVPDENGDVLFWLESDVVKLIKIAQDLKAENEKLKSNTP